MSIFIAVMVGILFTVYVVFSGILFGAYTLGILLFIRDVRNGKFNPPTSRVIIVSIGIFLSFLVLILCQNYLKDSYPKLVDSSSAVCLAIVSQSILNLCVALLNINTRRSLIFEHVGWYIGRVAFIVLPYPFMFVAIYHYFS